MCDLYGLISKVVVNITANSVSASVCYTSCRLIMLSGNEGLRLLDDVKVKGASPLIANRQSWGKWTTGE